MSRKSQIAPTILADIHAAAFRNARPWGAEEFQSLLSSDHVFVVAAENGFAMARVVVDEVELLTIAVHPIAQGKGIGRTLLTSFETASQTRGARHGFLEVAEDNIPAQRLYSGSGWSESGRRKAYYARQAGEFVDALLLRKQFPLREPPEK